MERLSEPQFWISLLEIIWINGLLSGDNAIVIALACRSLPRHQRVWGMVFGAGIATVLRILFTGIAVQLMALPYLRVIAGIALIWIAVKLVLSSNSPHDDPRAAHTLWKAIQIIAIADIIMSLDNVIAIAAVANDDITLIIIGLGLSIPVVVAGSSIVMSVLVYMPQMVWAGAVFLGWVAGHMVFEDVGLASFLNTLPDAFGYLFAAIGSLLVLVASLLAARMAKTNP